MAPSLYITDITNDPNNRSGDWQYGGTAIAPSAVFGAWKSFTRTVDYTTATPTVTLTAPLDPAKNGWNLGPGSDAPPAGLTNEGYGAEVRWNLNDLYARGVLIPGHSYRFYVIVHDGDQNKAGGDAGQAAYNYVYPGPPATQLASVSGSVRLSLPDGTDYGPLAGIAVYLKDSLGNVVAQTTTDAQGNYQFTGLVPGTYSIQTTANVSSAGTVGGVQDGQGGSGLDTISNVVLGAGQQGINYDFWQIFTPA
jgi:hypothetical protein